MSNWPKDYVIVQRSRPGTFAARMQEKATDWRLNSAKRYALTGAERAFRTFVNRYRGMDWGIYRVPTESLVAYTERKQNADK